LNPPSNPSNSNSGSELLLLLFPKGGLLLLLPTALNLSNRFTPIVLKYEKYSSSILLVPVILFYCLLSFWIVPIIVPISGFVKLNIFEFMVVLF